MNKYKVNGQQFDSLADAQDAAEHLADRRLAARHARSVNGSSLVSGETISECSVSVIRVEDGQVVSTHRP